MGIIRRLRYHPLCFQGCLGEVQQQPVFFADRAQIGFDHREVNVIKALNGFQFHHYRPFNKEIEPVASNLNPTVLNRYLHLLFHLQASPAQFNNKSVLIYRFNEPRSQSAMYLYRRSNNLRSQFSMSKHHANPLIFVVSWPL